MSVQDKMYICVLDTVPDSMVPVLVAHATLRHHLHSQNDLLYNAWLSYSFKKCVVKLNQKEFDKVANLTEVVVATGESTVAEGATTCLTVVADPSDYNVLKFAKLWKPVEANAS